MANTSIREILARRILILDGAMGTMIQRYGLTEADYRGDMFRNTPGTLKGCNDLLCLTRPDIITSIHEAYLQAGADIIETNTFNATSLSMADYGMEKQVEAINRTAVKLAKEAAGRYTRSDPGKPRFVAGSVGPTGHTCSLSPDVNDPAFRTVTYDELKSAYVRQIAALTDEGVDVLLIETVFDTLNAKAALDAVTEVRKQNGHDIPVMLSVTLADSGGRTLSGQTLEAFLASVRHAGLLSVGLNCSFGAKDMKPWLQLLSRKAPYFISAYPNAGLPNRFGEYDETPETMAAQIREYIEEKIVNIVGGCCGTTPAHIARYLDIVKNASVRRPPVDSPVLCLSGLELLEIKTENNFINIGERCNVAGSRKFLRLIKEKKYGEALEIARKQVEDGAQIIDINMDDGMLDIRTEMTVFLNLIASEPEISRVPLMLDSSQWPVLEAGLKCVQGRSVVNSISLKEGEKIFLERAKRIRELGAAMIIMAFDENGQADTFERKTEICARAYRLLTTKAGILPTDIIFDPNVLAIATGIEEHRNYAVDFIRATAWIKENLPGARVSGGISNLSFAFRGNNYIREAMHAVFLYHAIKAGLDMGIVNPSTAVLYSDIPADLLTLLEDVVLNRNAEATERLVEIAEELKNVKTPVTAQEPDENLSLEEKIGQALIKGRSATLENDLKKALSTYGKAIRIIDGPLMDGMNRVGQLFREGKMFLPQVVKSARVMKEAVAILQPYIEQEKDGQSSSAAGRYLLATVKGDVHDIGKNIVSVVLACNNFDVIDLGVMVPAEEIVRRAQEEKADFIGLSGLITPSLDEMCRVAEEMEKARMSIPLMIGGATTSPVHTAVKIAPCYSGPVIHVKDAAQNPVVATRLLNPESSLPYLKQLQEKQSALRASTGIAQPLLSLAEARDRRFVLPTDYIPPVPKEPGTDRTLFFTIPQLRPYLNWKAFFHAWKIGGNFASIADIQECDHCKAGWLASFPEKERGKAAEAMQLYKEAQRMLDEWERKNITAKAVFGLYESVSTPEAIRIRHQGKTTDIPCLRQQTVKDEPEAVCYALNDFILPETTGRNDYIGIFAVTAGTETEEINRYYRDRGDDYRALLLASLTDRLAEAGAEYLHYLVRTRYWGYEDEKEHTPRSLLSQKYRGIRPAVGYPSLPDQSLGFVLSKILDYKKAGIRLTENGAMYPASSVSGLMIACPHSRYFHIGQIGDDQRDLYCRLRGFSSEESRKWLSV